MQFLFMLSLVCLFWRGNFVAAHLKIGDSCKGKMHELIDEAFAEIPTMLQTASSRLERIYYRLLKGEILVYRKLIALDAVTLRTVTAFYYSHYDKEHGSRRILSSGLLKQVFSTLTDLTGIMHKNVLEINEHKSDPYMEVWCELPTSVANAERNNPARPPALDGNKVATIASAEEPLYQENQASWAFNNMPGQSGSVIILNKTYAHDWSANRHWSPSLTDYKSRSHIRRHTVQPPPLSEQLKMHLSANIIYQLSKLNAATKDMEGTPHPLEDSDCSLNANNRGGNTWDCVKKLSQGDPDLALRNALNYEYLVVALFLKNCDWSKNLKHGVRIARFGIYSLDPNEKPKMRVTSKTSSTGISPVPQKSSAVVSQTGGSSLNFDQQMDLKDDGGKISMGQLPQEHTSGYGFSQDEPHGDGTEPSYTPVNPSGRAGTPGLDSIPSENAGFQSGDLGYDGWENLMDPSSWPIHEPAASLDAEYYPHTDLDAEADDRTHFEYRPTMDLDPEANDATHSEPTDLDLQNLLEKYPSETDNQELNKWLGEVADGNHPGDSRPYGQETHSPVNPDDDSSDEMDIDPQENELGDNSDLPYYSLDQLNPFDDSNHGAGSEAQWTDADLAALMRGQVP